MQTFFQKFFLTGAVCVKLSLYQFSLSISEVVEEKRYFMCELGLLFGHTVNGHASVSA